MQSNFIKKIFTKFNLEKNIFYSKPLKKYEFYFKKKEKYELIRTHKNNVILLFLPKLNIFRKFSVVSTGMKKIIAEHDGLNWYFKRRKIKDKKIIRKFYQINKKFAALDLNKIEGKKLKSWDSINKNFSFLYSTYYHYKKIYPKKKLTNIHGDLTLDNIIFNNKKINIIDWEFFHAKPKLWGYDLAYLFLSSISIPFIVKKKITQNELNLFKKLWTLLIKLKINKKILYNPYFFFENSINKDNVLKSSKKISKKKFFPFITPVKFKKVILNTIKEKQIKNNA